MEPTAPPSEVVKPADDCVTRPDGVIQVDGSSLEGGGQILRNCTSLSALLQRPIEIRQIRGKRPKPGLAAQHLTGINLVKEMFSRPNGANSNRYSGLEVKSTNMSFHPGGFARGRTQFEADVGTAGALTLVLQVALPCALFAPHEVTFKLTGGTNASNAPQIDYTDLVFRPMIERFGVKFDLRVDRRGYFPKGGGQVTVKCTPSKLLQPVTLLDRGQVTRVSGRAFVSPPLDVKVAGRMAASCRQHLERFFSGAPVEIDIVASQDPALGTGAAMVVTAHTSTGCIIGGSSLGERGKPAEKVGEEAAADLVANLKHGGCVDEYLQDQLILFMALANGTSRVRTGELTLHTKTSIHFSACVAGAKFRVDQETDGTNVITCEGVRYRNPNLPEDDVSKSGKQ